MPLIEERGASRVGKGPAIKPCKRWYRLEERAARPECSAMVFPYVSVSEWWCVSALSSGRLVHIMDLGADSAFL